jgi:hypothetical protein
MGKLIEEDRKDEFGEGGGGVVRVFFDRDERDQSDRPREKKRAQSRGERSILGAAKRFPTVHRPALSWEVGINGEEKMDRDGGCAGAGCRTARGRAKTTRVDTGMTNSMQRTSKAH